MESNENINNDNGSSNDKYVRFVIESDALVETAYYNFNMLLNNLLKDGNVDDVIDLVFAFDTYMSIQYKLRYIKNKKKRSK